MDREPRKRRRTWFTKPRPTTLGQTWQQGQQSKQASDAWLTHEASPPQEKTSQRMDWQPLPPLPKWPPLPEESPLPQDRPRNAAPFAPPSALDDEQPTTAWDKSAFDLPAHDEYDSPEQPPSTLWSRFRSASRRLQVGIAVGVACAFVLCSLLGVAALNLAFQPGTSHIGPNGGGSNLTGNGTASPSASLATPTTTSSPAAATATPVPPFTIAFTCASGAIGGTGEVCVHTQPNAVLTLRVQYCDGSFAGGKSVQGTAHADGSGDHTWRWTVTTSCAGTATATVTAKSSGQITTQSTTFTITR
ncbi:MAG TPA: hypothetical protein VF510_04680 [Ktedonobacterales bacterium]